MSPDAAIVCWERALLEEIGIVISAESIEDKRRIENILYNARKKSGNPDLEQLMIVRPGDAPLELWIVKKTTDMSDVK